jgi:DNA-binding transcriptional LysR family regulator
MKQLRAFVAVYRSRKLATAAERLSVTSSAVSVLIRQTEESLKTRLFDRTTRSLEPTPAAHDAIGLAESILQGVALLEAGCRDLGERRRGHVHLAVTPAIGAALMPQTVRAFTRAHPDIQVIIDDCAPNQFLSRVLSDQVEFGIGTPENIGGEIEVRTLVDDHLCVVCAADHPLASHRQVRWVDLASVPVIAMRPGYGVRRNLDQVAGTARVELKIVNEVNFMASLMWMVSSGLGVSIVPSALVVSAHFDNLVARPLVSPRVSRAISIVTRRGRSLSPACQSFTDMLARDLRGFVGPSPASSTPRLAARRAPKKRLPPVRAGTLPRSSR